MTRSKSRPWRKDPPPHDTLIEIFHKRRIIKAKAIWGDVSKGILPHWEIEDGRVRLSPGIIDLWRPL